MEVRAKLLISVFFVVCGVCTCWGSPIIVDPNGSGDFTTIQAAIDDQNTTAGDVVIVNPGTYVENINLSGKAIILRSTDPDHPAVVAATIIDGNDIGTVITCNSGEDANTVIAGFVITNGNATDGGGMYNNSSSPTVSNCTFSGNSANYGGGMYNYNYSAPTVSNCTFSGNSGYSGGGMCNYSQFLHSLTPTVSNCTFSGNSANYGGGIWSMNLSPTVSGSYFCGNTPDDIVGIYNNGGGNLFGSCPDTDSDGIYDNMDNCPLTPNADQVDRDSDGSGDVCDNCPNDSNPDQVDTDGDGFGDICDDDDDNDGVVDINDNCPLTPNADQVNSDGDAFGDVCDNCPNDSIPNQVDTDGDGVGDGCDNCPLVPNADQADSDGDGIGDLCDGVLYVDDDNFAPYQIIQDAIDDANDGEIVLVMPGTYAENINMQGKAITLHSIDPNDPLVVVSTIIDGGGSGSAITCDSGEDTNTVIAGFVITNGNGNLYGGYRYGGGMYNDNSSPTVSNCTFSGNWASPDGYGGGMFNDNSSPIVSNCTFSNNSAAEQGGGMCNFYNSSPIVSNCTFSNNSAAKQGGGGMLNSGSSPTVSNCTFSGNSGAGGGGMYNKSVCSPIVSNCTFSGNSAYSGGGMCNSASSPTVNNCTFSNNEGTSWGGGMFNYSSYPPSSPIVSNCTFIDNTTGGSGGGMWTGSGSSPTVSGSYFCGNIPDQIDGPYTDNGGNEPLMFCPPPRPILEGDLDDDGDVDFLDFAKMAANWLEER